MLRSTDFFSLSKVVSVREDDEKSDFYHGTKTKQEVLRMSIVKPNNYTW